MIYPFPRHRVIYDGLNTLLRESQSYTRQIPKKLARMQEIYLERNSHLYEPVQIRELRYYQAAFAYKDLTVTLLLEQLWSLVHVGAGDKQLLEVLANIYDDHRVNDEQLLLLSFTVDNFLLQATAFLDFYLLYLCSFFHIDNTKYMSGQKLMQALDEVSRPELKVKAEQTKAFLNTRVFGATEKKTLAIGNWGTVLRDLRNSTIHRDMEYPSFAGGQRLVDKKTDDWPDNLRDVETARFAQDIQNDMFAMVTTMAATLYDLEWKPGPYRADLWTS